MFKVIKISSPFSGRAYQRLLTSHKNSEYGCLTNYRTAVTDGSRISAIHRTPYEHDEDVQFQFQSLRNTKNREEEERYVSLTAKQPLQWDVNLILFSCGVGALMLWNFWNVASAEEETKKEGVKEEVTGIVMPFKLHGGEIIGTTVRTVTFLKFATYAIALYLGGNYKEELSKLAHKDPKTLSNDKELFDNLILKSNSTEPKTIRIVPYRQIESKHFFSGLQDGLTKIFTTQNLPVDDQKNLLEQFSKCFLTKSIPAGSKIDFVWENLGKTLEVYVEESLAGSIADERFGSAFFEMYFGEQCRVAAVREKLGESLAKLAQNK